MNAAVLRAELYKLEKRACAIEEIVYKQLKALEFRKNAIEVHNAEQRIIVKLWKLDEIQDEIDCIIALLKEAGELQPPSYAGNVYQYNPPKQPKQKPLKQQIAEARKKAREEAAKHKVYPIESPTKKPKARKANVPGTKKHGRQSLQLLNAKHRVRDNQQQLNNLDETVEKKRIALELRLEERKTKVAEVANLSKQDNGSQKRNFARRNLVNVERQLRELPEWREKKAQRLKELIDKAKTDVELLEKDSQLV